MPYRKISKEMIAYNKRVGNRIKLFRQIKGISQVTLSMKVGFTSRGTMSLIESGKRGVDAMTLGRIAAELDTFSEILSDRRELTKEELIVLNKAAHIIKDPKHPRHKELLAILNPH